MRRILSISLMALFAVSLSGCIVEAPRHGRYERVWLPEHWAPGHVWVGGHWR